MRTLGIETTCDETAAAVVVDGRTIVAHNVASQHEIHSQFGGVFPEMASRRQFELLLPIVEKTRREAGGAIDLIAVAYGPGLIGSLFMGCTAAKGLSLAWGIPFIGVNHVEAHLYAALMEEEAPFPALGIVVSGGHTLLVIIHAPFRYAFISSTVDDAVGEAFDKVGTLLGLPYPAGPEIEKLARQGDASRFTFPIGRVKEKPLHLSFSGLKTSVAHTESGLPPLDDTTRCDLAASFQEAALLAITRRAAMAAEKFGLRSIVVGGGVSQNKRLRTLLEACNLPLYFPPPALCTDNAAMIAGLGYHRFLLQGHGDPLDLEPVPGLTLV